MNPQDKIEQAARAIHSALADGKQVPGSPDKVIVDRKTVLELLEDFNYAVEELLQSQPAGDDAQLAARKRGEEMIEKAQSRAEDVYAASLLYSDDMIGKLRNLIDEANDSVNDMLRGFRKQLRSSRELLQNHETELRAQLADLSDTGKYLQLIEQINQKKEMEDRDLEAEKERGRQFASNLKASSEEVHIPASQAKVIRSDAYYEKTGEKKPDEIIDFDLEEPGPEKPEVKVNEDAAYFKWRKEQERKSGDGKEIIPDRKDEAESENENSMTRKLPNEDALMNAMLVGETSGVEAGEVIASSLGDGEHLVKEVKVPDMEFDWKDMEMSGDEDLGGEKAGNERESYAQEPEPVSEKKKKGGKFRNFLLGN